MEAHRERKLDYAERWYRDALAVSRPPAFFQTLEVDVSQAKELIDLSRAQGLRLTYAILLVRAAAVVLKSEPDLHVMICGNNVYRPSRVDIALSIAGQSVITPVLIIEGADRKTLPALADEIVRRVPEVQKADREFRARLRRWGWILPFGILRRAWLRFFLRFPAFRTKGSGTFQVSVVQGVDSFATPLFSTCGMLTAGRVKDRVMVIDGKPVVRPTVHLTCAVDHSMWNGKDGERFLLAVREVLETNRLSSEIGPISAPAEKREDQGLYE
jgi:pyruvate/2-oxoglutarate dehydrogenase complex dihydrolipoamide acyltransferase (E2) component